MNRRAIVPRSSSIAIRDFGLHRDVLLKLLNRIHEEVARDYEKFKNFRAADNRYYVHRMVIPEVANRHLFVLGIDDSTSPEHLIISNISHRMRKRSEEL